MVICKKCGDLLSKEVRFCPACGQSVDGQVARVVPISEQATTNNAAWLSFKDALTVYLFLSGAVLVSGLLRKIINHPFVSVAFWAVGGGISFYYFFKEKDELLPLLRFRALTVKRGIQILIAVAITLLFIKTYFSMFESIQTETEIYSSIFFKHGWPIWSIFALVSICPGIIEEVAFRGVIYGKLKKHFNTTEALCIQAACFSVLHLLPTIFISHFVMGLLLGWVRERTKSLVLSMLLHMAWNAYVIHVELI